MKTTEKEGEITLVLSLPDKWLRSTALNFVLICGCIVLMILYGCGKQRRESTVPSEGNQLSVYVVNYPLQYFAERIAGSEVRITFPAPADCNPAFWNPSRETIAAYQKADVILINGASYAKWLSFVSLPPSRIVDTSASFTDRFISVVDNVTHSHGAGGEHSHSGTAYTTWLDFSLAVKQADAINKSFQGKRPVKKDLFQKNFETLSRDFMALDQQITTMVATRAKQPLIGSHPIYQYFSRRYRLNLESVMWEPGEYPSEEKWKELEYGLQSHEAHWMIWEKKPLPETVERLKLMGVQSLVYDPCFNVPDKGDFMDVMKSNVENLQDAYM
jgi:zinc transport system substrate-binding protein